MAKPKTKVTNPIDIHVGSRLRMRRLMLNVSQEKLGDALGITFQQVQKYEKGTNRISASRLQQAAQILHVTAPFFRRGAGWTYAGRRSSVASLRQRVRLQRRWAEDNQS